MDVVALSKLQFAVTVAYHFLFVPLSIGLGLFVVLAERKHYKSGLAADKAAAEFWIKLFTATFAVGVATGITMEFAFGTNWATYSRFVGDIFGAPLAAEGLFAFFLESTFLAVLLFGRNKVSRKFFYVSTWLVWAGSLLSALWIIIANSWMQSPAGYKIVGEGAARKAVLTNFFAAGFNPTTLPRYFHTVDALLMMGGFAAMGLAAYYLLKGGKDLEFGRTWMKAGIAVTAITTVLMLPMGHWQAVSAVETQPEKVAAFEGMWEDGPLPLGIVGWVDSANKTTHGIEIPGGVNLLAGDFGRTKVYEGLNTIAKRQELPPVEPVYQVYHLMVLLWGVMLALVAAAWLLNRRGKLEKMKGLLKFIMWAPVFPMLAIQLGWAAAEMGRQPWIVWGELKTVDAISKAVPAGEIVVTLALFVLFYTIIYIAWARVVLKMIRRGPALAGDASFNEPVPAPTGGAAAVAFSDKGVE